MASTTTTSNRKTLYLVLAFLVVAAVLVALGVASYYEPGAGTFDTNGALWGLAWGFGILSVVVLILLVTLRSAATTVREAEEVRAQRIPPGEEKEHVIKIEGIGEAYASRLHQNGIITIPQLLRTRPEDIAPKIDVMPELVREWQAAGQLMQVKGIGPQYAEILTLAGVRSIGELAQSEPTQLTARIDSIEESRKVRVLGTDVKQHHVEKWVGAAKDYMRNH